MQENIDEQDDLLRMLDSFLRQPAPFWDEFFSDRDKPVPIFMNAPDENLVSYVEKGLVSKGKVLDVGCGPGRNALYLAEMGFEVDAVDASKVSLNWASERAEEKNLSINFLHQNIFDAPFETATYDFIYDSGCFHHIAPHRRMSYIEMVEASLKIGGSFGITCFLPGGKLGGADISDWEVYRNGSLSGGLGYSKERLISIFHMLEPVEVRTMKDQGDSDKLFGVSELLTALFVKK
ncbi:class I SAM-dependent methyltransferase [Bacillus sp. KH172YL63]|uniref:class I SAM-dependent methyltransferase n=1 Tax=Bacillus sp. KH172YL63 TaxID=2709784 RepID=UPI0013E44EDA|nr:class I SAM-dependent methyltransferase [Bacillus sp. KH172YL63]BCB03666.1 methyltransferase [Bacillus sp. KH172YL63]